MPKRPTDILWELLFMAQVGLLIWEHGFDKGKATSTTEDPEQ